MSREQGGFCIPQQELDENIEINFDKIWKGLLYQSRVFWSVFFIILALFILLAFIMPKKYKVSADLFINKSNSSNMTEINPYLLDEASRNAVSMGADKAMNNEIELIKSSLVLDSVIKENNIVYKKKFGIIPNKKEGEYLTAKVFYDKGKVLKIENLKNTNVISIEFRAKKPEFAYNVVSSIIDNYIELHKTLNSEKSKSDRQLIEEEYEKAKKALEHKLKSSKGMPAQTMSGIANFSAMSAFSNSASQAMGTIRSQYLAGERSSIAISEENQKVQQLAAKLEWAKMVEQMSDSSKVLVLHAPQNLKPYEYASPSLKKNIIFGIVFGLIAAFAASAAKENNSGKLTYSKLTNNIIFDWKRNIKKIKAEILGCTSKKVLIVTFSQVPEELAEELKQFKCLSSAPFEMTENFADKIAAADKLIFLSKIGETDAADYKTARETAGRLQKDILFDLPV